MPKLKMTYFDIKVGYTCNNDCIHCVVAHARDREDMTTDQVKSIINERKEREYILFTGGEATIRNDFIDLIRHAKERGHNVALQTNGTRFSDLNFAREAGRYIDNLLIAIHSHDEEVHDEIVRVGGMYDKTIRGFKNIVKMGIRHKTQTVISRLNAKNLKETYSFIQDISPGCKMNLTFPHPMGNAYINKEKVVPKYSEIKRYLNRAMQAYSGLLVTEAIPICYLYPYHNAVENSDERMLKRKTFLINERRKGLNPLNNKDIIDDYSSLMLKEKRKGPDCIDCFFNDICVGVWKEYMEFYSDDLDLTPFIRR